MGVRVNPGNTAFEECLNDKIYIDKTELITFTNQSLGRFSSKYICFSRPRRFGKTMMARMLAAYYSKGCDSRSLFQNTNLCKALEWDKHLNKFSVIYIDLKGYSRPPKGMTIVDYVEESILKELRSSYPECTDALNVHDAILEIGSRCKERFVFIIDEWDLVFRDYTKDKALKTDYLSWLEQLFKDSDTSEFISLAYFTGILPIGRYNTQSSLNNFREFTMVSPKELLPFVGFTNEEVQDICVDRGIDYREVKFWYNGYLGNRVYNPKAIVEVVNSGKFGNYWSDTVEFENLGFYINQNLNGLRDSILSMLSGQPCYVDPRLFSSGMSDLNNLDKLLTLLVHLGYLAYDEEKSIVYIPNQEIHDIFMETLNYSHWDETIDLLKDSERVLYALLTLDADQVAATLEKNHDRYSSIIKYNDENSLACVIELTFFCARKYYNVVRELPSGKGYADIVFLPKFGVNKPAIIMELKYGHSARSAILQIRDRNYPASLEEYKANLLLVGINYKKDCGDDHKHHECEIEWF